MQNPYPGINPHLNSRLQQQGGGWRGFHTRFLAHFYTFLENHLPENYLVAPEEALQIGVYEHESDSVQTQNTVPDLLIRRDPQSQPSTATPVAGSLSTPTFTLDLKLPEEKPLTALVIYREGSTQMLPVTRIELLSPANKSGGSHYRSYMTKRTSTLAADIRLIEIDLLHEQPPLLEVIPDYRTGEPDSYPYHVLVSNPSPSSNQKGKTLVYGWYVQDRLPTIPIPLFEDDQIVADLNPLYQETVNERFLQAVVDYNELPEKFDTYQERDQQFIREKIAQIAAQ